MLQSTITNFFGWNITIFYFHYWW